MVYWKELSAYGTKSGNLFSGFSAIGAKPVRKHRGLAILASHQAYLLESLMRAVFANF